MGKDAIAFPLERQVQGVKRCKAVSAVSEEQVDVGAGVWSWTGGVAGLSKFWEMGTR